MYYKKKIKSFIIQTTYKLPNKSMKHVHQVASALQQLFGRHCTRTMCFIPIRLAIKMCGHKTFLLLSKNNSSCYSQRANVLTLTDFSYAQLYFYYSTLFMQRYNVSISVSNKHFHLPIQWELSKNHNKYHTPNCDSRHSGR